MDKNTLLSRHVRLERNSNEFERSDGTGKPLTTAVSPQAPPPLTIVSLTTRSIHPSPSLFWPVCRPGCRLVEGVRIKPNPCYPPPISPNLSLTPTPKTHAVPVQHVPPACISTAAARIRCSRGENRSVVALGFDGACPAPVFVVCRLARLSRCSLYGDGVWVGGMVSK